MKISHCPFCGDCDSDRQVVNEVGRHYRVYCLACGADGPIGESEDSAIKLWNHRPDPYDYGDLAV